MNKAKLNNSLIILKPKPKIVMHTKTGSNGRIIELFYTDTQGNLVVDEFGINGWVFFYDEQGKKTGSACYGLLYQRVYYTKQSLAA